MESVLVPLDVQALPVGSADSSLRTVRFAGATVDFTRIGGDERTPNTSENILRPLSMGPAAALDQGVHLHWALPDALSHGRSQPDGRIVFPQVPNRWLVSRLMEGTLQQWIVESDRLMTADEYADYYARTGRLATAIPFDDPRAPYRYIGCAFDAKSWSEDPGAARLASLTAVGYGGAAFAAYYPDCLGVFGFHDPLTHAPDGDLVLTYHVVGWYSDPKDDPCSASVPVEWTLDAPPAGGARTVCGGVVRGVVWNAAKDCVVPGPDLSSIKAAIGNTTTEAFAALLAATWKGPAAGPHLELLLDAFQLGLLAKADLLAIEDALHQNAFGSTDGGSLWAVKKKKEETAAERAGGDEADALPDGVAHLLNELNEKQQAQDARRFELESRRRQVYLDWYRYIYTLYRQPPDPDASTSAEALLESELDAIEVLAAGSRADVKAALEVLRRALPAGYEARTASAPRYWQPREPVLLLAGDALAPVDRNGTEPAICKLASALPEARAFTPASVIVHAEADKILAGVWAEGSPGDHAWTAAPWLPLFLSWTAGFTPAAREGDEPFAEGYLRDNFRLDDGHIELQPTDLRLGPEETYRGDIPLSTRGAFNLADQISRHAAARPEDDAGGELAELARAVADMPIVSQSLSGLNLALLTRKQTVQLPPSDPFNADPENVTASRVVGAVGSFGDAAPLPDHSGVVGFHPIRAGILRLSRVEVVDVFGRRARLESPQVVASAPLRTDGVAGGIYLPPRFTQPARLVLRWLSAAGETEMNDHPATTPICGWVIPNHWDDSLAFYTAAGLPLGALALEAGPRPVWRRAPDGRPVRPSDPEAELARRTDVNETLRAFIVSTHDKPRAFLADLLTVIETACLNILPGTDAPGLGVLMGRPLALADVSLGLELQGLPAADTRWDAFRRDADAARAKYDHSARSQAGFTRVKLGVRLGDLGQSADGLVGHLTGDGRFYSAAAHEGSQSGVAPAREARLEVDAASPPQRITLLLDPRVPVHATTGALPIKRIAIPPAQYAAALKAMQLTFPAHPVLVGANATQLPVPSEPGYRWSWLRPGQPEVALEPGQVSDKAGFDYSPQRIQEGWLKLCK